MAINQLKHEYKIIQQKAFERPENQSYSVKVWDVKMKGVNTNWIWYPYINSNTPTKTWIQNNSTKSIGNAREKGAKKCIVIRITQKNKEVRDTSYKLYRHTLDNVDASKYLGVSISNNLSWNRHIDNIVGKGNRTLATKVVESK